MDAQGFTLSAHTDFFTMQIPPRGVLRNRRVGSSRMVPPRCFSLFQIWPEQKRVLASTSHGKDGGFQAVTLQSG